MASAPETTLLVAALAVYIKPTVIVETGTYKGHTTAVIAQTLLDCGHKSFRIWTAEIDDQYAADAAAYMAANGLDRYVTVYHGDAQEMLETVPGTFDFAYVDGGHNRIELVEYIHNRMSDNGLVLMDDANQYVFFVRPSLLLGSQRGLAVFAKQDIINFKHDEDMRSGFPIIADERLVPRNKQ